VKEEGIGDLTLYALCFDALGRESLAQVAHSHHLAFELLSSHHSRKICQARKIKRLAQWWIQRYPESKNETAAARRRRPNASDDTVGHVGSAQENGGMCSTKITFSPAEISASEGVKATTMRSAATDPTSRDPTTLFQAPPDISQNRST
jgi:hypothetical protein